MSQHSLADHQHSHNFLKQDKTAEKHTLYVLIITAVTMLIEIVAGSVFGSMALLADGWHMATHVAAFLIALFAYRYARQHADNPIFTFGTGKVTTLGGFASSIALLVVALMMIIESIQRLAMPQSINFNEAIWVAVLGLGVNLVSAVILQDNHHHHHHHHEHKITDHNLKAAYVHVLTDALTSVLAIVALLAGKLYGVAWLDSIMGIVGGLIISRWAYGLIKQTSPILLDAGATQQKRQAILTSLENQADNGGYGSVSDLHVWQLSDNQYAAIIAIVAPEPQPADFYKALLKQYEWLAHVNIEVIQCAKEHHTDT